MIRPRLRSGELIRTVIANCSARLLAMLGLTLATVLVARIGGPAAVGEYALLRMIPGLVGVLCVLGLPGALAYFLAEPRRELPRLWPTLMAIGAAGALLGTIAWLVASPLLARVFFPSEPVWLIAAAGATVPTQLLLTLAKTSLQGLEDRHGGDVVIAAEELAFLPCYVLPLVAGVHGLAAIIIGLGLADVAVAVDGWRRVSRRLGWKRLGLAGNGRGWWGRPDRALGRQVASYGLRGQVGGLITLLNLRLDFAVLGAMAGPAVLGAYAVASKYAELLRLPGTALTWVFYPRLAKLEPSEAATVARRMVRPALIGVLIAADPGRAAGRAGDADPVRRIVRPRRDTGPRPGRRDGAGRRLRGRERLSLRAWHSRPELVGPGRRPGHHCGARSAPHPALRCTRCRHRVDHGVPGDGRTPDRLVAATQQALVLPAPSGCRRDLRRNAVKTAALDDLPRAVDCRMFRQPGRPRPLRRPPPASRTRPRRPHHPTVRLPARTRW